MTTKGKDLTQKILERIKQETLTYIVKGKILNVYGLDDVTTTETEITETIGDIIITHNTKKLTYRFSRQNGDIRVPLGTPQGYILKAFEKAAKVRGWTKPYTNYSGFISFLRNGGVTIEPKYLDVEISLLKKINAVSVKEAKTQKYSEYLESAPFEITVSVMKNRFPKDAILTLLNDLEHSPIDLKNHGVIRVEEVTET
jgi:hypothetical protein